MSRLPNLSPSELDSAQRAVHDKIQSGVGKHLSSFTTHKADGTFIGPYTGLITFPEFGGPLFDLFLALVSKTVLPFEAREVVILTLGGQLGALYEIYSHESVASSGGMPQAKFRTLAAGERPSDLSDVESIAREITVVLLRGHELPASLYEAAVSAFTAKGVAEIACLIGCYSGICSLCNAFNTGLKDTDKD